jgi:transposase
MHAQSRQLHRKEVAEQVEGILDAHPLAGVAYAGIAPVTRSSGTSINGEHPARTGNRQLKRAFFLAAFAALSDPVSRAYYDRE